MGGFADIVSNHSELHNSSFVVKLSNIVLDGMHIHGVKLPFTYLHDTCANSSFPIYDGVDPKNNQFEMQ